MRNRRHLALALDNMSVVAFFHHKGDALEKLEPVAHRSNPLSVLLYSLTSEGFVSFRQVHGIVYVHVHPS